MNKSTQCHDIVMAEDGPSAWLAVVEVVELCGQREEVRPTHDKDEDEAAAPITAVPRS